MRNSPREHSQATEASLYSFLLPSPDTLEAPGAPTENTQLLRRPTNNRPSRNRPPIPSQEYDVEFYSIVISVRQPLNKPAWLLHHRSTVGDEDSCGSEECPLSIVQPSTHKRQTRSTCFLRSALGPFPVVEVGSCIKQHGVPCRSSPHSSAYSG
jgi:hypothetical protein